MIMLNARIDCPFLFRYPLKRLQGDSMEDKKKTKEQLINELTELRKRVAALENKDGEYREILENFIRERLRHKRIVEDLPDLICRYRPDTTITFVNEAYAKYFGKSVEDLIGTSFLELIPSDSHKYVRDKIASLNMDSPVVAMEHEVVSPDGQIKWQRWRDRALFNERGEITEIQAIGQDITEQKEMEEAVRSSEEKFRQMAENIREVFWLFDCNEQKVIYVSPAYTEIWGRSVQDLYDRYDEWANSIHPDDIDFAKESFEQVVNTGAAEERKYRIVRPDGSVRWVSDKAYAIYDENGEVYRIAGTAEDITTRKTAEEKVVQTTSELEDALAKIKTLKGLIPICAWCKKIRDDRGYWKILETYLKEHSEAEFTHGICPDCLSKVKQKEQEIGDVDWDIIEKE
jgi:PAS domain S-box-containing protein